MLPQYSEPLDILIIGGGIVGAGVARDAAMRGLHVALVERYDFAFGTSSRSSRLLHGGIRYLAQGRIGLVREANHEKIILQRIAPHLAQPLPFLFPTYSGTPWPRWKLGLGVKIYDWLCGTGNLGPSSTFSRDETLARLQSSPPESTRLTGSVRYFDGLTNDARLVIDTLRSAARHGALVANYTRFTGSERIADLWECTLESTSDSTTRTTVKARCVVCAVGPWAGGLGQNKLALRLTKGIHLVIDHARLPVTDAVVITEGQRVLFAIPWGKRVILGTTDTDFSAPKSPAGNDPLAKISADASDIDYVLKITNANFPSSRLTHADIISTWAGLRPLIANPNGTPSDISRAHEIRLSAPGWIEIAGGKLTTYRLMAEQTVDRALQILARPPVRSKTALEPLLPPADCENVSAIVPPPFSKNAVEHYCRNEWAQHLPDVMIRRGGWHHYFRERKTMAEQAAAWMAECLNWDESRRAQELADYFRET